MLNVGVFGAGHLGKIHLKCLQLLPDDYRIAGFYDPDPKVQEQVAKDFGVIPFSSATDLMSEIDVVDIVTPTSNHHEIASEALTSGRHVFVEKPVTTDLSQALDLQALVADSGLKFQVGHVERYNPAFLAVKDLEIAPMFVEGHRLATFNPRGTDVSVVLDLMIHDLDLIVHLIPHPFTHVHASGVAVISNSPDICNARIEFANGAVANLTASRISVKQMRKLRLFQKDAYISLDFLEKESQIIRLYEQNPGVVDGVFEMPMGDQTKWVQVEQPSPVEVNAIQMELAAFAQSIREDRKPDVSIDDAVRSMHLAQEILTTINANKAKVDL